MERGIGEYQLKKAKTSEKQIIEILSDGKWHRYQEVQKALKLSTATLSKHLKRLEKSLIEKRLDLESGEYPYPVFYRLKPQAVALFNKWREFLKTILEYRLEDRVKNPERFLESLNQHTAIQILEILKDYYENGNETMFQQQLDYTIDAYKECLAMFKSELEKVYDKQKLAEKLKEAQNQLARDYEAMLKARWKKGGSWKANRR